ncbi:hypothetical protein [Nocardia sp. NPDC004860]|uniref:hypothetical protein n=1 Tax=Nocardia sp. NPDC004860 TaxID=3154557 RepID=UPI0033A49FF9
MIAFDLEYAPIDTGWAVRVLDHPDWRIDVADEADVRGLLPRIIARKLGLVEDQITLSSVQHVDHIPGRDAPLRVESPATAEALRLLDEQLENPYA